MRRMRRFQVVIRSLSVCVVMMFEMAVIRLSNGCGHLRLVHCCELRLSPLSPTLLCHHAMRLEAIFLFPVPFFSE